MSVPESRLLLSSHTFELAFWLAAAAEACKPSLLMCFNVSRFHPESSPSPLYCQLAMSELGMST